MNGLLVNLFFLVAFPFLIVGDLAGQVCTNVRWGCCQVIQTEVNTFLITVTPSPWLTKTEEMFAVKQRSLSRCALRIWRRSASRWRRWSVRWDTDRICKIMKPIILDYELVWMHHEGLSSRVHFTRTSATYFPEEGLPQHTTWNHTHQDETGVPQWDKAELYHSMDHGWERE